MQDITFSLLYLWIHLDLYIQVPVNVFGGKDELADKILPEHLIFEGVDKQI